MKKVIYNLCVNGFMRPVAKPMHSFLIETTLVYESIIDYWYQKPQDDYFIEENVTAVIKTFERPKVLKRLILSLRKMYPKMNVIIADDSKNPSYFEGIQTIALPYDSGVSFGRNEALKHVQTPFILLLDDDFIFYRHTKIEPVLKKLKHLHMIDIIGGEVIYLPFYRKIDYTNAGLHPTNATSVIPPGTEIEGMKSYDKVANFYIAKTDSIRKVAWDPSIKRLDHADFFTRAKGVLTTLFDPAFKVLHARTPFDKDYMSKRMDIAKDKLRLREKFYL